jgi:hypothetical protein
MSHHLFIILCWKLVTNRMGIEFSIQRNFEARSLCVRLLKTNALVCTAEVYDELMMHSQLGGPSTRGTHPLDRACRHWKRKKKIVPHFVGIFWPFHVAKLIESLCRTGAHVWLTSSCPRHTKGDGRKMSVQKILHSIFFVCVQAFLPFHSMFNSRFQLSDRRIFSDMGFTFFFQINGVSQVKSFYSLKSEKRSRKFFFLIFF